MFFLVNMLLMSCAVAQEEELYSPAAPRTMNNVPFEPSLQLGGAEDVNDDLVAAGSAAIDVTQLQRRLLNSAGAYLPGLGYSTAFIKD
jgi:hypothetical protein